MSNSYTAEPLASTNDYSPDAHAQTNDQGQAMDGRQAEYSQPGLSSPFHHPESGQPSEGAPPDQASGAQYQQGQDAKFNPSATPTSEYGMTPQSTRSNQFPEYAQRPGYAPDPRFPQAAPGQHPGMQTPQSPSQPLSNGIPNGHHHAPNNSNDDVPVDPSIAAASPTYPPQPPHYPPPHYPQHDMHYQHPPPIYGRPGEYPPHAYGHPYGHYPPPMMGRPGPPGGGVPLSTVYSFVPIPGTHQQKRPRRRYEEIERMYKCGWQGCEKAYGTLNHLNAHVTMQAHGVKRTPEEFKEIRKEWKQRKKEDDAQRKADGDRPGTSPGGQSSDDQHGDGPQATAGYAQRVLPPVGYQPAGGQPIQPQPYPHVDGNAPPGYPGGPVYYQQGPGSPYPGPPGQMYAQAQPPPPATEGQPADGA